MVQASPGDPSSGPPSSSASAVTRRRSTRVTAAVAAAAAVAVRKPTTTSTSTSTTASSGPTLQHTSSSKAARRTPTKGSSVPSQQNGVLDGAEPPPSKPTAPTTTTTTTTRSTTHTDTTSSPPSSSFQSGGSTAGEGDAGDRGEAGDGDDGKSAAPPSSGSQQEENGDEDSTTIAGDGPQAQETGGHTHSHPHPTARSQRPRRERPTSTSLRAISPPLPPLPPSSKAQTPQPAGPTASSSSSSSSTTDISTAKVKEDRSVTAAARRTTGQEAHPSDDDGVAHEGAPELTLQPRDETSTLPNAEQEIHHGSQPVPTSTRTDSAEVDKAAATTTTTLVRERQTDSATPPIDADGQQMNNDGPAAQGKVNSTHKGIRDPPENQRQQPDAGRGRRGQDGNSTRLPDPDPLESLVSMEVDVQDGRAEEEGEDEDNDPDNTASAAPSPPGEFSLNDPTRPFICQQCQKAYTRAEHLKRHVDQRHSKQKPFSCPVCNRSFARRDVLKKHINSKHPENSQTIVDELPKAKKRRVNNGTASGTITPTTATASAAMSRSTSAAGTPLKDSIPLALSALAASGSNITANPTSSTKKTKPATVKKGSAKATNKTTKTPISSTAMTPSSSTNSNVADRPSTANSVKRVREAEAISPVVNGSTLPRQCLECAQRRMDCSGSDPCYFCMHYHLRCEYEFDDALAPTKIEEYPPMSEPFVNGLHGSHYSPIHHPQLSRSASHSRQVSPTIPLQRSLSSRAYTNGHYNPYSHPQLEDHPSTAGAALAEPTAPVGLPVYGPYPFQQPPGPYHPTEPERAEVENSLFLGPSRERSDTLVELSQDAEGAKSLLSLATPRENVDMSRMGSRDSGFFTAPTVPEEEGIAAAPLSPRVPHPAAAVEDVYHSSSVLSATSVPVPPRHLSSGSSASGPIPLLVDPGVGRLNGSSINIGDEPKLPPSRYDLLMLEQLVTSIKAQVFELYAKSPKLNKEHYVPDAPTLGVLLESYFHRFHDVFPVIHVPTFDPSECDWTLLLSMACIGAKYCKQPERAQALAETALYGILEVFVASYPDGRPTCQCYQAIILLQWHYLPQPITGFLHVCHASSTVLDWLREDSESMRFQPHQGNIEDQWRQWIDVQEKKRLGTAYLSLAALASGITGSLAISVDCDSMDLVMPDTTLLWNASSAEEWGQACQTCREPVTLLHALQTLLIADKAQEAKVLLEDSFTYQAAYLILKAFQRQARKLNIAKERILNTNEPVQACGLEKRVSRLFDNFYSTLDHIGLDGDFARQKIHTNGLAHLVSGDNEASKNPQKHAIFMTHQLFTMAADLPLTDLLDYARCAPAKAYISRAKVCIWLNQLEGTTAKIGVWRAAQLWMLVSQATEEQGDLPIMPYALFFSTCLLIAYSLFARQAGEAPQMTNGETAHRQHFPNIRASPNARLLPLDTYCNPYDPTLSSWFYNESEYQPSLHFDISVKTRSHMENYHLANGRNIPGIPESEQVSLVSKEFVATLLEAAQQRMKGFKVWTAPASQYAELLQGLSQQISS